MEYFFTLNQKLSEAFNVSDFLGNDFQSKKILKL